MKVLLISTLVVGLLIGTAAAAKTNKTVPEVKTSETSDLSETSEDASKSLIQQVDTNKKEKEIHKRGILHYGSGLTPTNSLWPKTYASHYGYGIHLPAAAAAVPGFSVAPSLSTAHLHAPSVLRYNNGFHYKTLAAPAVLSGTALPSFAVPHVHPAASSQPFIIRPGGAVVQSYSVTYPHRKAVAAVKPVHAFASATPVQHLHPVHSVQPVNTFQHVHSVQHVPAVQPVTPVATVQPVPPVAAVQPVHPVQPAHHLQPVQPVHHLHPVSPVQTVVQIQHFKPPTHYDVTQQLPPFFQTTSFAAAPASVPAIPQAPPFSFHPVQAVFPDIPAFPNPPAFPTIPAIPQQPSVPDVPAVPAIPSIPSIPNIPTIPSIPNFPQPQVPANSFFPISMQPPLNQKPPLFATINPQAQFPGFGPIPSNTPDFGSAEASPQIPAQPLPSPEPELPAVQPDPNQQPWKPISFEPPTAESPLGRPSNTLLPPYGSSPAQGYLPPAPSSSSARLQQDYAIDSSLFDNLSDADIQQIFSQASLAAQRDHEHHHHTVHNYHSHY